MPKENNEEVNDDEDDVYDEENVEKELEDDEVSPSEAGFMEGYDRTRDKEFEEEEDKKEEESKKQKSNE